MLIFTVGNCVPGGDVLVHDPLPRRLRQLVPGPRLHHRVDQQVLGVGVPHDPPALVHRAALALHVLRAPGHREVGVGRLQVGAQRGARAGRCPAPGSPPAAPTPSTASRRRRRAGRPSCRPGSGTARRALRPPPRTPPAPPRARRRAAAGSRDRACRTRSARTGGPRRDELFGACSVGLAHGSMVAVGCRCQAVTASARSRSGSVTAPGLSVAAWIAPGARQASRRRCCCRRCWP